ncbi:hypothetical protein HNP73_002613 [Amaricoccus macauensis]|uniref:Uncharacterized protein n=1 Tax=Amaricoccus macauensis TaxID=57001 RepID=A0A840SL46_9RHOB|nr:hypothetical protein [Amaricoccus macauensis]
MLETNDEWTVARRYMRPSHAPPTLRPSGRGSLTRHRASPRTGAPTPTDGTRPRGKHRRLRAHRYCQAGDRRPGKIHRHEVRLGGVATGVSRCLRDSKAGPGAPRPVGAGEIAARRHRFHRTNLDLFGLRTLMIVERGPPLDCLRDAVGRTCAVIHINIRVSCGQDQCYSFSQPGSNSWLGIKPLRPLVANREVVAGARPIKTGQDGRPDRISMAKAQDPTGLTEKEAL